VDTSFQDGTLSAVTLFCCRWEGNIKLDLAEVGLGVEDSTDLVQDRDKRMALVSMVK
jgi:hypothetical protein